MSSITSDEAMEVVREFSEQLVSTYGASLKAVYAIGSLGGDYYRPGQSDIDTWIILGENRTDVIKHEDEISRLGETYRKRYNVPKGFGAIVVCEEHLYPPYVAEEELVLEIVRLKTQSRLVYGHCDLSKVPMPDKQAIIAHCNVFEDWRDREGNVSPEEMTRQMAVNSILLLLNRYLMIACGKVEFNKFRLIDSYLASSPPFVNDEVFSWIEKYLINGDKAIRDDQLLEMIQYHEFLKKKMNSLLLDRP